MRRLRPTIKLRAIATATQGQRRDAESAFEAFARLAAASGPWMLWFGIPQFPSAQADDREGH